ncbi:nitrogen fixation protein NifQ [Achromobacter xylosoxidans]|uniref:nitrogen fixation protein NifQ n=1 Tax=Alcaligenes xylosoxydans xylosoxydans TaxID=85698 RepID=UPI0006C041C8|nr:nitrogen fixation protein NifQ [Achromobacter xylosoxidans]MDH0522702.1 nitrogen fixation protein NifQ [Achromobacter xylosoxidans]MDH0545586.1 nitrogen fixation protein NifQ [Achromobacter xylosoxidans]CUJ47710.1 NifQ [Achromobacter xylosoxidans]
MDANFIAPPAARDIDALASALLAHASSDHPDARFFATVIGKSLAHGDLARTGLSSVELAEVLASVFPGTQDGATAALADLQARLLAYATPGQASPQPDFTRLLRVLLEACGGPAVTTPWVTSVLAHACLRPDHLWRDLGLKDRDDVTALLTRHYPGLVARNTQNLRWKKFLAYSAFEHAGLPAAAAPGCSDCEDRGFCYGASAGS